jgi:uncharacterized RDD family membrane protein YckC
MEQLSNTIIDNPESAELIDASQGIRFANYLIDLIVFYAFSFAVGFVLYYVELGALLDGLNELVLNLISLLVYVAYYTLLEGTTGKTIGKMITGTRVVTEDGQKPGWGQLIGRNFTRLIPFEPFTMLTGNPWHDSWTNTRVVKKR